VTEGSIPLIYSRRQLLANAAMAASRVAAYLSVLMAA